MYLRYSQRTKNGKTHTYWRVVRSVRVGKRIKQETVVHLGPLGQAARSKAKALARHFLGPKADQRELFEDTSGLEPQRIRLNAVSLENGRSFGDVWFGWTLWRALKLDEFLDAALPSGRETVTWAQVAAILVLARLCDPSSELHIAETWYRQTALSDILGVDPEAVHTRRLYEGMDHLLTKKVEIEDHLKRRLGELFGLDYELLLYDVTSTFFEGLAVRNTKAARGYSRDHRPDCKQVCIGLVVTHGGFPVAHEVFDGNRTDVTTLKEMVDAIEGRFGKARRIWVMDRGMVSEDNLEWLRETGRHYVVGTPRSELKKWEQKLAERRGWEAVRDGLEVKLARGPQDRETFLLCRSEDRRIKEAAMHARFRDRVLAGLGSLGRRLKRLTKPADRSQVERQIGRLLGTNSRAASLYKIEIVDDRRRASGLRVVLRSNRASAQWAAMTEGTYILRSNVNTWTPEDLWRTYIQLCEAEAAFRIQKSDLQLRPVWHQREDRVRGHIFICFIAYALWKTMQGWQQGADLGSSPRTLMMELARIQSADVVLPLVDGGEARLRCVVRPSTAQATLLDRLGLSLPTRLRVRVPAPDM